MSVSTVIHPGQDPKGKEQNDAAFIVAAKNRLAVLKDAVKEAGLHETDALINGLKINDVIADKVEPRLRKSVQKPKKTVAKTVEKSETSNVYEDAARLRYTGQFVLKKHDKVSGRVGKMVAKVTDSEKETSRVGVEIDPQTQAADDARRRIEEMNFANFGKKDFGLAA